jgi:hypothetical protein
MHDSTRENAMNCPNCNAQIDAQMQACLKCGAAVGVSPETTKPAKKRYWTLGRILFWFVVSGFASALMFPAGRNPLTPNMAAVATRGRDIFIAMTGANSEGGSLQQYLLWPKTCLATTNHVGDVPAQVFKTSTEYFEMLLKKNAEDTSNTVTSVPFIDASKFSGAGIPRCPLGQKLTSTNNLWLIAANVTPEDSDRIPLLITRNVDVKEIERAINYGITTNDFITKIPLGKGEYKTPFGNKVFVCVRKGGGTFSCKARWATLGTLFDNKELPPRDPSKPPIVYLMP